MPTMGITSGLQVDMATMGITATAARATAADTDAVLTTAPPASLFLGSLAGKNPFKGRSNPANKFQPRVVARWIKQF